MGCSDIDVWIKLGGLLCVFFGVIALIVPASLVIQSYNTEYTATICSSNISKTRVKNTAVGTWYATADTTEAATGYHIRLVFPAFPGRQALVGETETAANAWISRISAGSPTATFDCLVVETPQPGKTVTGISSRQTDKLVGWIIAMVCSVIFIIVLVVLCFWFCREWCCARMHTAQTDLTARTSSPAVSKTTTARDLYRKKPILDMNKSSDA